MSDMRDYGDDYLATDSYYGTNIDMWLRHGSWSKTVTLFAEQELELDNIKSPLIVKAELEVPVVATWIAQPRDMIWSISPHLHSTIAQPPITYNFPGHYLFPSIVTVLWSLHYEISISKVPRLGPGHFTDTYLTMLKWHSSNPISR